MKGKTFFSLITGVAAGALLGVLIAPDKGTETRAKLKAKLDEWEKAFVSDDEGEEEAPEEPVGEEPAVEEEVEEENETVETDE